MHSIATPPVIPLSTLAGIPPVEELPTPIARRRYAFTLAVAGERSYEISGGSLKTIPLWLQFRALQEDRPMTGTTQTISLMQPLPLPKDPAERAVAATTVDVISYESEAKIVFERGAQEHFGGER